MHRFYAAETCVPEGAPATLPEEDARHAAQVLRLRAGDEAELFLGGARYRARALEISPRRAAFTLLERLPDTEPALWVTLFQGLPKGDKLETVIQKSVELGVKEIVPVMSARTIVRLDEKRAQKKTDRWNSISLSAAKQSKRSFIPKVDLPHTWKQALERSPGSVPGKHPGMPPQGNRDPAVVRGCARRLHHRRLRRH